MGEFPFFFKERKKKGKTHIHTYTHIHKTEKTQWKKKNDELRGNWQALHSPRRQHAAHLFKFAADACHLSIGTSTELLSISVV